MPGFNTEFETGLLDDFDFTIERAYYAPDGRYNEGNTLLLQWEGKTDNVDVAETHLWFPLGKGWISTDGGKTIHHESGRADKYFQKASLMAKLIARCVDDFGIQALLDERGDPFTAATWVGLQFHIKSEMVDFGGGNIEPKSKQMPIRFNGVVGDAAPAAKKEAKSDTAAADKIAAAKAKATAAKANGGGDLKAKVVAELKKHTDFEPAQNAALQIDGVSDDDELLASLMDDTGLWAEVNA